MFILLEPGMEIKAGDLAYTDEEWSPVDAYYVGPCYTERHFPIKRQIRTIDDLFASYNRK